MSEIRRMHIKRYRDEYEQWVSFLNDANIRHEDNVDYTYGVFEGDTLIATGSIYQNILKCIAVCKKYTGGGTLNQLISFLMNEVLDNGYTNVYVYTKPSAVESFKYLGFKQIAAVGEDLVFLEKAMNGFDRYLERIEPYRKETGVSAAIVMNANPFTKGHQYLVEYATIHADHVFVFVLSEDASTFPASVRRDLVEKGTAHFANVTVLDTGNYMVSNQTFPSYFLKEDVSVTAVQATLDATIFKNIATVMNITKRFVGEEPYSEATAIYNQALQSVLEPEIHLNIIPRKEITGDVISASRVRKALFENDLELVQKLVPTTTYDYLMSEDGQTLISEIRNGGTSIGKI